MATAKAGSDARVERPKGVVQTVLWWGGALLIWTVVTLFVSIVVEWVGLALGWWAPGHAREVLLQDLSYLNQDFRVSILTSEPVALAAGAADGLRYILFEWTGAMRVIAWFETPRTVNRIEDPVVAHAGVGAQTALLFAQAAIGEALRAAVHQVEVFGARSAILALAMPAFFLAGVVAAADGIVERDVRRWCAGRESGFQYHHAKRVLAPAIGLPWVLYLSWPTSVHPNVIIIPFVVLFALAIRWTCTYFKKYL